MGKSEMTRLRKKNRQQELAAAAQEGKQRALEEARAREGRSQDEIDIDEELKGLEDPQERRINTPNPSAVDRLRGTPNDYPGSKRELEEELAGEVDYEDDSEEETEENIVKFFK